MYDVFLRFPDYKAKAVTLSYDDGVEQDEQLIDIFDRYGLKAAFNINTGLMAPEGTTYPSDRLHRRLPESRIKNLYRNHELACHSLHHKYMDTPDWSDLIYEITEDKKNLEEITGEIVRGFACPYGRSSEKLRTVLEQLGMIYSRGVGSTMSFALPKDLLNITPTCRHSDPGVKELIKTFMEKSPLEEFHDRHPWLFYMWGHSFEFERDDSWGLIEEIASELGGHGDVWYATNIEVFSYISNARRLVFSANGELAFNPTSCTLWLESDGEYFNLLPGETKKVHRKSIEEFVHTER